jgi:GMP synthase PP-ATPase subunit
METKKGGGSEKQLDLNTTVSLLIGFLRENNLSETMASLSEETGVQVAYIPNKAEFIENIKRGAWHQVLKTL